MTMGRINSDELEELLNDTTKKIKSLDNNIKINTVIENLIIGVMDSEFASLWVFDEKKVVLLRERENSIREISMLGQRGVLAKCFLTLSGGIYNYIASEKEYVQEIDNPDNARIKSKIIIPILDGERLIGLLTAYSSVKKIRNFSEDDMELLESMTPYLSNIIYQMHPNMRENPVQHAQMGQRLIQQSCNILEKSKEIEKNKMEVESSEETLNFMSNTVHDIRTPANTLYGFLELLEEQLDNPRLLEYIHNAKESAEFINHLTTSILDRMSSQRERTKSEPVQLNPIRFFSKIADNFSANMSNKNINFNIFIDPLIPKEILLEDLILKRVIMNLISNAYKFTASNKTVDFSVEYKPGIESLGISIKDTGIGISKEKQEDIFKAFVQAEDDTNMQYGGTGLGLSISAQYVKDMGGELKIESELEVGSTFYFDLPIHIVNEKTVFETLHENRIKLSILLDKKNVHTGKNLTRYLSKMGITNENIIPINNISNVSDNVTHLICFEGQYSDELLMWSKKNNVSLLVVEETFLSLVKCGEAKNINIISQYAYYANDLYTFLTNKGAIKVLIADDDRINIQLIRAILEDEFCQIETAMDGETALNMLESAVKGNEPYHLVYLDNHMPNFKGKEVLSQFRAFEKKANTRPVHAIYISGDAISDENKDSNFNAYIGKPFNKKMIKSTLNEAISKEV